MENSSGLGGILSCYRVLEQPQVRYWYAKMLIDRGAVSDRDEARRLLEEAISKYETIGMPRHGEMAQRLLASLKPVDLLTAAVTESEVNEESKTSAKSSATASRTKSHETNYIAMISGLLLVYRVRMSDPAPEAAHGLRRARKPS